MSDERNILAQARILIAEDEATVAEDLALKLQDLGYQVIGTVSTGELAVRTAEESKPDLVLMDIKLRGDIDGIQASEQIRTRFDIPFIFLAADEHEDLLSRATLAEPYGFLPKPVSYNILKAAVESALCKHAADKRVKESEQQYRMLVEQSADGITLIQGTTLRFANSGLAKMFGFQPEEQVEGRSILPFLAPEYRDLMEKMGSEREEGKSVPDCYEFTALRKDGTRFPAEVRVNLTTYRGEKARQGIIRDITERRRLEEELRQSQQMLSLALEGAKLGTWDWDLTTGNATWSERVYRMLGYSPNQFEPNLKNWKKRVHPDDWPRVSKTLNLHLEGRLPNFEVVYRIPNKTGEWRWLQAQGKVTGFSEDRKPIRITGVVADITDRKEVEEALRESEERFRQVAESAGEWIWEVDANGLYQYCSSAVEKILGYSPDELVGRKHFYDLFAPGVREELKEAALSAFERKETFRAFFNSAVHKNGNIIALETSGSPVLDEKGNLIGYRGTDTDVTERTKAEAAMRQQLDFLQQLIDTIPTPIFYKDVDGKYMGCNTAFESDAGMSRAEIVGKTVFEVAPPGLANMYHEEDLSLLRKPGVQKGETSRQDAAGNMHEVMFTKATFSDLQGNIAGMVGVIFDITDRKEAEEALRHSEERYRALYEDNPSMYFTMDAQGTVLSVNQFGASELGYSVDELIGQPVLMVFHPDDRDAVRQQFAACLQKPMQVAHWEFRKVRKDGSMLWVKEEARSILGTDGNPVVLVVCEDITDRKRAEDALRRAHEELEDRVKESTSELRKTNEQLRQEIAERKEAQEALRSSEEKYRLLVDKAPIGIVSVDTEGRVLEVNQRLVDMLGSPSADATKAINVLSFELMVAAGVSDVFSKCLKEGADQSAELPYTSKWGKTVYLRTLVTPLFGENGDVKGCQGVMEDVSERKRIEQALRESEERLELALRGADLAIWDYNLQTGEATFNARRAEMVGYSMEEAEPRLSWWGKQVHPDDVDGVLEAFNAHAEGRSPLYQSEHRLRHKSGEYIWILARAKIVERDERHNPVRMVGTTLDITDRKKAEEGLNSARNELERRVEQRTAELRNMNEQLREQIAERMQVEEALRDSEERLRAVVYGCPVPQFVIDRDHRVIYWNKALEELTRVRAEEVIGTKQHWKAFYHQERPCMADLLVDGDREGIVDWYGSTWSESRLIPDAYDGTDLIPMVRTESKWLSFTAAVIGDSKGNVMGAVETIEDITERKQAEEALTEREEFLSLVVENIPDMIFIKDAKELKFVRFNKAGEDLLGYKRADLIGKNDYDFFPKEQADFFAQKDVNVLESGRIEDIPEEPIDTKTGRRILHTKKIPLLDKNGKPAYLLGISEDITERKKAEEALQIRDSAIASSISGVVIADVAGVITYVNPAALRLIGYDEESEVLGRLGAELLVFDDRAKEGWKTTVKTGSWVGEMTARRKDGSSVEVLIVASVVKDNDDKPIAMMGSFLDITDRKRAEKALRESEEKYRALFEESRDALYITTRDGKLVDSNQAFLDLFGLSKEEARDMDILKLYLDPADRKRFQDDIERNGSLQNYEARYRKQQGAIIECVHSSALRLDRDGTILGYQGMIRDVTEYKQLQRQLLQAQKMEALGILAGGIAHDFNNLLQVIVGYSEVLLSRKDKADPECARLQQILQAGRSGAELVQGLLTLSRKTESKQRPVDLNHQVKQARRLLDRTIPKMIKIELRLEDLLKTVNADPTQIEQIIMNIAINARDSMQEGGKLALSTENVTLNEDYCRMHPDAKPGKYVLLAISDTGSGMDKQVLDHMFEPFFTTKGVGMGTGLGLAVVYGIVKQHGGHITCESQLGRGTVFKVYLPAIEEREIVSDESAEKSKLPGGTETILLVDDEDVVRNLGELILSEAGYEVLAAKNGKEALEIFQNEQGRIAMVVLDLLMPEMGGKQCMQELLKINPAIRVLIASGYASGGTARDAVQLGAKAFVNKPFNVAQLLQQVRTVLDLEL